MKARLHDGTEIDCGNFTALDSGVLLTKDKKRKKVFGFVPMAELKYVVPDDFEATPDDERDEETVLARETRADRTAGDERADESTVIEFDDGAPGSVPASEEDYVELTDDDTKLTDDDAELAGRAESTHPSSERSDLLTLGSLGRASAERLRGVGVRSLADLAVADPSDLAASADVPPGRARRWVTAANARVGSGEPTPGGDASVGTDVASDESASDA